MNLEINTKRLKEAHFIANKDEFFDIELIYFPTQKEYTKGYMQYCDTVHSICNLENIRLNGIEIDMEEDNANSTTS